ncbi:hypothetical protein FTUN_1423 [Frigoriglobus tundricola]|uniref:Uncharacterized protein n=1 Tax=Frigoriglobus tundricola TaxID=2774151 RepID=A0A6M5YIK2_9BACT|nr:hypothetical protein FTUN_1423 [Frigoriglobus tundricola]
MKRFGELRGVSPPVRVRRAARRCVAKNVAGGTTGARIGEWLP